MRSKLTAFVQGTFKFLSSACFILIFAHLVFLVMCLLDLKIPEISATRFVNYPIEVFLTDFDSHYGRKSADGTFKPFEKDPFNLTLHNEKDTTDTIQVTTITGSLTVDVSNKRDILALIFLERIGFLIILFIGFVQLDKLFSSFRSDDPFNPKNSKRLKIVAYLIIGLSPIGLLFNELNILAFKVYKIDWNSFVISHNVNPQYIFLGLLILIVSLAFEAGSQLKKESEYTI
jgi:hypothetical protein